MALDQYKTQILLLHSQQSTLDNLCTGFDDQYSVHIATSGTEALNIFTETPVHVIVSAQDLPGMSGLDALREAKKRSPETIGILLAGTDQSDGLEALVGDEQVFQIVRGEVTPEALVGLVESATKRARLLALAESANDTTASLDQPITEHIIMETSENGSAIISDGTGQLPALKPQKISIAADAGGAHVDVLVLTKDEEFLATIRDSARGLHNIHHAVTPTQADEFVRNHKIGVLVTDAAMVGSNIELLTQRLRKSVPRLVAVVAGRRDDGELLMDLINRGQVYRFLLKPVSPGRARLAIEASVKHHLEAADDAFKGKPKAAAPVVAKPQPKPQPKPKPKPQPKPAAKAQPKPQPKPQPRPKAKPKAAPAPQQPAPKAAPQQVPASTTPMSVSREDSLLNDSLDEAFDSDNSFTETMTGIAVSVGKKIASVADAVSSDKTPTPEEPDFMELNTMDSSGGLFGNPRMLGIIGAVIVIVAAGAWMFLGSDDVPPAAGDVTEDISQPSVVETDILPPPADTPPVVEAAPAEDWLELARDARDDGNLITPRGESAIDYYINAVAATPDNIVVATELDAVVELVFGLAESAILDQRLDDAAIALQMIQLARPESSRLPFLTAQLEQLQLRQTLDDARLAIREGRFEDAGALINTAGNLDPGSAEVSSLSQELSAARSAQRIDEVLALANSRLEQDRLITPSNNNARYYYELALSIDPDNTAARQGITIVSSKLALQARAAIDAGQLTNAEDLLRTARALDPTSTELAASTTALQNARDKIEADRIAAEEKAETDRIAAANRAAEEKAAQERAARERAAQELAAQERAAQELAAQERAAQERAAEERAAQERAAQEKADEERATEAQRLAAVAAAATTAAATQADANSPAAAAGQSPDAATGRQPDAGPAVASNRAGGEPAAAANNDASTQRISAQPEEPAEPEMVAVSKLTRINYVSPKYPRSAQRRNITGSVDIAFTVRRNGSVANIEVLNSSPGTTFDQAATDAVAQWRFEPAIENGRPVEKRTAVRLAFNLQ